MQPACDPTDDHEQYVGEVIPDPWDDPKQTDWPDNPEPAQEVDEDGMG